ncbi:flagellar hook-associated protein FlgL [Clostridium sp. D2Q-11]|uniref:Flagellar hook-associated protein FlgL n=1 Tax=Anaeromonas frigoriresistens TaxID=2683708 RepID=A0A942Z658_9FIRM|nr:flagellar hook-associated protein FlgL [Anaeromonas frigoriresistens]MBS4538146.1 flagellar hook-associated protein FlgL [Anaeromonas frigoriresistens]
MRVTNNMLIMNMMNNMNNNLGKMDKVQQKMASGKKFQMPSDDPIGVSKSLKFNTDLSRIEQYKRNVDDATSWLEITETAVGEVGDILQRVRELTVQAANGTNAPDDRTKISSEIEQLKKQVIKVSNTKYAGRSIFTGYKTDKNLLDENGNYIIDLSSTEKSTYNVGPADDIEVNIVGNELFGLDTGNYGDDVSTTQKSKIIDVFDELLSGLNTDDDTKINDTLVAIDDTMDNVLSVRANIGAKVNRLDLNKNRLDDQTLTVTKLLSNNEDVDMAETIMELKVQENVYRASLSAGARVIQPTLIDFLR